MNEKTVKKPVKSTTGRGDATAFAAADAADPRKDASCKRGKVYLVGAGPGDPELLTLKGRRLIDECDVIVFDRLVGKKIMDMIPEGRKLIDVGKNVGDHPVPQYEINKILLREALDGKQVLRLKGGDPFVFGRGGEELELLAENGVEFEVIPGITSSIAVPAYAGIPVTHRDFCSSFHIITGHAKAGGELSIDFDALVRLNGTLVFMMSVSTVGMISNGLRQAGMDGEMPCAVIENGTGPSQRSFVSNLDNIEKTVYDNSIKSPAVIIVGRVCSLADSFNWFEKLPLRGLSIVVTQPEKKASKLEAMLRKLGAETKLYPCIKTEYIRPLAPELEGKDVLVFTSAEGVNSFFEWLLGEGKDARCLSGKKIACIGPATAGALRAFGIGCDFMPREYYGRNLAEEMISTGFITGDSSLLLLRAEIGSEEITGILSENAIDFTDYPVYTTSLISHEEKIGRGDFDYVSFTSRSCVEGFVKTCGIKDMGSVKALCIGEKTAELAADYGMKAIVSDEATIVSMVDKIIEEAKNEQRKTT